MPRPPRLIVPDQVYHVISRGSQKRRIFHDKRDYEHYLKLLRDRAERHSVQIFHYVLMPNHVHLLVRPRIATLSTCMKELNHLYSRYHAGRHGKVGHVWQNRFRAFLVDSDAYLFACGNYIEMNPVRAGLSASPGEWPYSSFHHYASAKKQTLISEDPFYLSLAKDEKDRCEAYTMLIGSTRSS